MVDIGLLTLEWVDIGLLTLEWVDIGLLTLEWVDERVPWEASGTCPLGLMR